MCRGADPSSSHVPFSLRISIQAINHVLSNIPPKIHRIGQISPLCGDCDATLDKGMRMREGMRLSIASLVSLDDRAASELSEARVLHLQFAQGL